MSELVNSFADCFKTNSPNNTQLAGRYVSGLLSQTARKNMERMDERLGEDDSLGEDVYQATQQFISASRWDHNAVYRQLCVRADRKLGGSPDTVLVIDESGHTKKEIARWASVSSTMADLANKITAKWECTPRSIAEPASPSSVRDFFCHRTG